MKRVADVPVVAKWRDRIIRWRRSGLSITEFCHREQISQPSFFGWRKRLSPQRAVTRRRRPPHVDRDVQPPHFVQLPSPDWATTSGVQIALPGGVVVTMPSQASVELVTAVLRTAMLAPASEDRRC